MELRSSSKLPLRMGRRRLRAVLQSGTNLDMANDGDPLAWPTGPVSPSGSFRLLDHLDAKPARWSQGLSVIAPNGDIFDAPAVRTWGRGGRRSARNLNWATGSDGGRLGIGEQALYLASAAEQQGGVAAIRSGCVVHGLVAESPATWFQTSREEELGIGGQTVACYLKTSSRPGPKIRNHESGMLYRAGIQASVSSGTSSVRSKMNNHLLVSVPSLRECCIYGI